MKKYLYSYKMGWKVFFCESVFCIYNIVKLGSDVVVCTNALSMTKVKSTAHYAPLGLLEGSFMTAALSAGGLLWTRTSSTRAQASSVYGKQLPNTGHVRPRTNELKPPCFAPCRSTHVLVYQWINKIITYGISYTEPVMRTRGLSRGVTDTRRFHLLLCLGEHVSSRQGNRRALLRQRRVDGPNTAAAGTQTRIPNIMLSSSPKRKKSRWIWWFVKSVFRENRLVYSVDYLHLS